MLRARILIGGLSRDCHGGGSGAIPEQLLVGFVVNEVALG
jgi:hypothetical protein